MLTTALIAIIEFLLTHIPQDAAFFADVEKLVKSVFNLIIKANHPNTDLYKLAAYGLQVLADVDAAGNPAPVVGGAGVPGADGLGG